MADDGLLPQIVPANPPVPVSEKLTRQELDYLLLDVYVRTQHLRYGEALTLLNALVEMGEESPHVLLSKAVVESLMGDHQRALSTIQRLEQIEPAEIISGKGVLEKVRIRSFLKARAKFALLGKLDADSRAALDFFLRQGKRPKRKKKR